MRQSVLIGALVLGTFMCPDTAMASMSAPELRSQILELARSFEGQGDPDFSRQQKLDALVQALIKAKPQPPLEDRLPKVVGTWRQVWGPYDYRNNTRGVDPSMTVDQIYQVIFPDGFYYNINPVKGKDKIALLRGEYRVDGDRLRVRFTDFWGYEGKAPRTIWDLAGTLEQGLMPAPRRILPSFLVRLFLGGGQIREVYTDDTLRIAYSTGRLDDPKDDYLYVLERVR